MAVDIPTVRKIASLARIAITEEEAARIAPELDNIMGWIEQLGEVDTTGVAPMTAVIDTTFADRATKTGSAEKISASLGGFFCIWLRVGTTYL